MSSRRACRQRPIPKNSRSRRWPAQRRRRQGGARRLHRLAAEPLEQRLCLALAVNSTRSPKDGGSINLDKSNTLNIRATDANDDIRVTSSGGNVVVTVYTGSTLQYYGTWPQAKVGKVYVDAGRGGDMIDCRGLTVPTLLKGSYGSDLIYGGDAADEVYGGDQEDLFIANRGPAGQDYYDGGDDNDGLLSQGTDVRRANVDSCVGVNLPFQVSGWQRSASGKWELSLWNSDLSAFPGIFSLNQQLKAAVTADGLAIIGQTDAAFFQQMFGTWHGSSPADQSYTVSATADRSGNLTWRFTVPGPALGEIPVYGDLIDALSMAGLVDHAETLTFSFRWENAGKKLALGLDYSIEDSKKIAGVPCRAGVDVSSEVTLAFGGIRRVTDLPSLLQNHRQSSSWHAQVGGIKVGCGGEITPDRVRFRIDGVGTITIPIQPRHYWSRSFAMAAPVIDPVTQHAVFVVDTLDDTVDPSVTSLRSALDQAANVDAPVDIVFSEALATGVPGAVNTINVGPPYPYNQFMSPQPLVVNNTWGRPITIDASAIGGIAISGQGMRVGDADGPSFNYGNLDPSMPDPNAGAGASASGAVTLRGITFDKNSSSQGGAIEVYAGAQLTLDDCVLSRNTSTGAGGAVYVHGSRPADGIVSGVDGASVTVTGGQWWGNSAGGDGGVFYVERGGTLAVAGEVSAHDNSAVGSGGVIWSGAAADPIYGQGGFAPGGGSLNVSAGLFWNNSAGGDGGAIWAREATLSAEAPEWPLSFMYNSAGGSGGAIAIVAEQGSTWSVIDSADIRLNTAGADGGGVAVRGATGAMAGNPVSVTVRSTLAGNRARATGGDSGSGGGLFVGTGTFIDVGGSWITMNTVGAAPGSEGYTGPAGDGGGVFVAENGAVVLGANAEIEGNSAINGGGVYFSAGSAGTFAGESIHGNSAVTSGGGLFAASAATLAFLGDSTIPTRLEGNSAARGGGLFLSTGVAPAVAGMIISGNSATFGGGILAAGGGGEQSLAITGSTISGNTATVGGGAWLGEGVGAAISSSEIRGNAATAGDGGGVFAAGANTLSLSAVSVFGNNAAGSGGGIALGPDGSLTASASQFEQNVAAVSGGGVRAATGSTVTFSNSSVSAGSAGAAGGGVRGESATISFVGGSITANSAVSGAGISVAGGSVAISGTLIAANAATASGGGIAATNAAVVNGTGVVLSRNTAAEGAGVALLSASRGTFTGGAWNANTATQRGGGGLAAGGSTLSGDGVVVTANTAASDSGTPVGGGIAATAVAGNEATGAGAGVWLGGGTAATFTATTVAGNTAGGAGGGLLVSPIGSATLTGTIVARNTAALGTDIAGAIAAGSSFNLVGVAASGGGIVNGAAGNLAGSAAAPLDPLVAAFGGYGGTVPTVPLLPGSPAIDAGTGAAADQRGVAPVGRRDIGCFESRGFRLLYDSGTAPAPQTTPVGTAFPSPLTVRVAANYVAEPVVGGRVAFTAPASGASAAIAAFATLAAGNDAGGTALAAVTPTANAIAGSYAATARLGAASLGFALTNRLDPPLTVMASVVNGGAVQRSNVTSLAITFSRDSNLASLVSTGGITSAVQLFTAAGAQISLAASRFSYNAVAQTLTIDLRLAGTNVTMLADARYQLRLDTTKILVPGAGVSGQLVDGDGTADGVYRVGFHELAGDTDGDATVSAAELAAARLAFSKGLSATATEISLFDFSGDGRIDSNDYARVQKNYGKRV